MYIAKTINKCTFASKLINRLLKYQLSLVFMIYSCMDTFNKVLVTKNNNGYTIDIHGKANTTNIMLM